MEDSRPVGTPMSTRHKIYKNDESKEIDETKYIKNDWKFIICSAYKA